MKAAFATFGTFAFYFFFGAFHDSLKHIAPAFSKYSIILPFILISYILLLWYLKIVKQSKRLAVYLNILFIILIAFDLFGIIPKLVNTKSKHFTINEAQGLQKPNVYLLVLDGYAGFQQLQSTFKFTNESFLSSLSTLGFTVAKSATSNYAATPFSMASLLSMSYHDDLKNLQYTDENLKYCYKKILQSEVVSGFRSIGYHIVNNSIFDIKDKEAIISKTFLKSGTELITAQTLLSRVRKDLYYNFIIQYLRKSSLYKRFIMEDFRNNELLYEKTFKQSEVFTTQPLFIYTHLLMPHFPYYFNAKGELNDEESLGPENLRNKNLYLAYLQFVNGKVLNLLKQIIQNDKKAVILLLSDHGYRYANDGKLMFSNLSAIYDSESRIRNYTTSISNVNVFRVLFNDLFKTNIPLLPSKNFFLKY